MLPPRREQVLAAGTINANQSFGPFINYSRSMSPSIIVDVFSTGATGTSPTLSIALAVRDDAGHLYILSNPIALTASTLSGRQVFQPIFEGQYEIVATVGGTTPAFNGVDINCYMSSPDA